MTKKSAGILLYRLKNSFPEVLLAHPGGPFFVKKDLGVWTIPKGEYTDAEEPLEAAKREFKEETGMYVNGEFIALTPVKLKSSKTVNAWAIQGDIDPTKIKSNLFELEWPPKSGLIKHFPEIDKAEWFNTDDAKEKINPGQIGFIEQLEVMLNKSKPQTINQI
ncbi:MAG: NUDIX domain-containing protein [Bacteroidetes bacterium]|nr:NUDIX domain-containing protein [Bacteroidota bacterium]